MMFVASGRPKSRPVYVVQKCSHNIDQVYDAIIEAVYWLKLTNVV